MVTKTCNIPYATYGKYICKNTVNLNDLISVSKDTHAVKYPIPDCSDVRATPVCNI